MAKLSTLTQRAVQHLCIFGEPGTGKSTLVSKLAAAGYNLIWFSVDNGHTVLFKLPSDAQERINLIQLPDTKDFQVGIDTCLKVITGAGVEICNAHGQVKCSVCQKAGAGFERICLNEMGPNDIVVFDPISQVATSAMNFVLKGKDDLFKPEWDHYRMQGTLMDKFLTNVQQAPYNVICITHVVETELEDKSKKLVPQIGSDKFSRNSSKYFDHVVFCEVLNKNHKFGSSTGYKASAISKSRTDIVLENMDEPTLVPFFDGTIGMPEEKKGQLEKNKNALQGLLASKK